MQTREVKILQIIQQPKKQKSRDYLIVNESFEKMNMRENRVKKANIYFIKLVDILGI